MINKTKISNSLPGFPEFTVTDFTLYKYISDFMVYFTYFSSFVKFKRFKKRLETSRVFIERFFKDPVSLVLRVPVRLQKSKYENDNLDYYKSKRLFFVLLQKYWYFINFLHILTVYEKKLYLHFFDFIFTYWRWAEQNKTFFKVLPFDKYQMWMNPTNDYFLTHISLKYFYNKELNIIKDFKNLEFLNVNLIKFIYLYVKTHIKFDTNIKFNYFKITPVRRRRKKYRYDKHKFLKLELRQERERLRQIRIEQELKEKEEKKKNVKRKRIIVILKK